MKNIFLILLALSVAFTISASPAPAALFYSGELEPFTGAGSYTLDIYATSTGGDLLQGYNLQLDFTAVGIVGDPVLTGIAPLNTFPTVFPVGPSEFGFSAFAANEPLEIADGTTETIASITFDASSAGVITFNPAGTFADNPPNGFIPVPFSESSPALIAAVIPEPSSLTALACIGFAAGVGRRGRKTM